MINKSLAEEREVELLVSDIGNVMLLYSGGPLNYNYQWAQFDEQTRQLEFITEDGDTQAFGLDIVKPLIKKMQKTKDLLMIEITKDNKCRNHKIIKFAQTLH